MYNTLAHSRTMGWLFFGAENKRGGGGVSHEIPSMVGVWILRGSRKYP